MKLRLMSPEERKHYQVDTMRPGMTPKLMAISYLCPHCGIHAQQNWYMPMSLVLLQPHGGLGGGKALPDAVPDVLISVCHLCDASSIWRDDVMVYPSAAGVPLPTTDMPEDVKVDYLEARDVYGKSPRAAGALLRVGFEKLFPHLGVRAKSPNDAIGELVEKGLVLGPLQKALDSLRIFTNQAVHNGFVKLEDQPAVVQVLFGLMNQIVGQMITKQKELDALYNSIPQDKRDGIAKRDGQKT